MKMVQKKIIAEASLSFRWALLTIGGTELLLVTFHSFFALFVPVITGLLFMWYLIKIEGSTAQKKVVTFLLWITFFLAVISWFFRSFIVIQKSSVFLIKDIFVLVIFNLVVIIAFVAHRQFSETR